jgi:hypothetical protein
MNLIDRLQATGERIVGAARDAGSTLMRVIQPGERSPAPHYDPSMMAPWPNVDRYPIIIGSNVSFQYIAACQRQAQIGYRLQWMDLLRELVRRDPSAYGNLTSRILASAGGKINVISAAKEFPADELGTAERERVRIIREQAGLSSAPISMSEDERILANQIAAHIQHQIDHLPRKAQTLAQQLWSIYYGVSANELLWARTHQEWRLTKLHFIHPRRISYPDQYNWDPHIWDQGLVAPTGPEWKQYLTQGMFGFNANDFPNKFLIHTSEVLSGYPTEDGLGFILAWWIAAKLMGARNFIQFIEKYAKPGTVATYNTKQSDGKPRDATPEDIALAQQVVQSMGYGGAPGAAIPDSIELELFGPAAQKGGNSTSDPKAFVEWCDDQIARAIKTTSALQGLQRNGSRSALEVLVKGSDKVTFYDAVGLSGTWTRDVALPITRLNYPSLERLCPTIVLQIEDEPGPDAMLERIQTLVGIGAPLDADKAVAAVGMAHLLADKNDPDARILFQAKALEVMPTQKQNVPPAVAESTEAEEDRSTQIGAGENDDSEEEKDETDERA